MRGRGDVAFTAALGLVGLWMVYRALDWPFSARLVPLAMGLPFLALIVLLGITFAVEARSARKARGEPARARTGGGQGGTARVAGDGAGGAARPATGAAEATEDASLRAYAVHGAWFGVFMLAVWTLGFPVGGTLSVAAYLVYARSHWLTVVILTLAAAGFFWAAVAWMQIRFPDALLW